MSSTIKYKGATIATAENNTKTLQTSGKYLEGDIEVTDVSSTEVGSYGTPTWSRRVASGQMILSASYPDFDDGYFDSAPTPSTGFTIETKTVTPSSSSQTVTPTSTSHYLNQVTVNPIAYSVSDEGKVVSNGALTAQTSKTVTENGTYDTTTNDEVVVNVSGGGGVSWDDIATQDQPSGDIVLETATSIDYYSFAYRIAAKPWTVYGPNITYLNQNSFRGSTYLTKARFPRLTSQSNTGYTFYDDARLELVDWGLMANIPGNTFVNCRVLNTLILRKSNAIVTINNVSNFRNTPFASGGTGGTIYIPKVFYDALGTGTNDYKAATNWSTLDGYGTITWAQIEGSPYEDPDGDW